MTNGQVEAALLRQGAGVGDDCQSVHLQLVVVVEAQRLVDPDTRVKLEAALFQFKTQLGGEKMNALTAEQAAELFYAKYLQGQYSFLVQKGHFFLDSTSLSTGLDPNTRSIAGAELGTYKTAGATEDAVIVRLERNVPQRIRVFIWLEGQDADCTGAAENLRFAVNLQLAGANS